MVSGRTISGASVARESHSLIWVAAWGWVVLEAASIIEYKVNDEVTQKNEEDNNGCWRGKKEACGQMDLLLYRKERPPGPLDMHSQQRFVLFIGHLKLAQGNACMGA